MFRVTLPMSLLLLMACTEGRAKRAEKQLADLKAKQEAQKAAQTEEKLVAPVDVVKLDPPYDDTSSERLVPDGACPEGLWALFPGPAPGETPEEKKANEARRAGLKEALKGKQFMFRLRAPHQVTLQPHDAAQGLLPIHVLGTVDCSDALGHVAIAWTPATSTPANPAAGRDEPTPHHWAAPPLTFTLPIKSMSEAKSFAQNNALGLTARVVFTFGKGEVDKKLKKVAKVAQEAAGENVGYGGGVEDWGAGRLVRAELIGYRVAVDQERKQLYEQRR